MSSSFMIATHPQRIRQVRLCPRVLSDMLLNNGTYTFVSRLPHDAKAELVGFDPAGSYFFYLFSHPSFDVVDKGERIPVVPADHFFIQPRISDAEFADTIK